MDIETIVSALVSLLIGGGVLVQLGSIKATMKHALDHMEDHEDRLRALEGKKSC